MSKVNRLIVLLSMLALAAVSASCSTSGVGSEVANVGGDSLDQTATATKSRVAGPSTVTSNRSKKVARTPGGLEPLTDDLGQAIVEGEGSITISGPNTSLVELDRDGFNQAGTGPSGHGAIIDLGQGQTMTFFSSTSTTTTREVKNKDGTTERLTIQSDPTSPTKAYGDSVLSPLAEYYKSRTSEQKAAFIAGVKANSEVTKSVVEKLAGPEAWAFLTSLLSPVP